MELITDHQPRPRSQPIQLLSVDESLDVATRRVNGAADFLRAHDYQIETVPISTGVDTTERPVEGTAKPPGGEPAEVLKGGGEGGGVR